MLYRPLIYLLLLCLFAGAGTVYAQEQVYTGELNAQAPTQTYALSLQAGDSVVISAEATDGNLDTVVSLVGTDGTTLIQNDDRHSFSTNSAIGYTATISGTYKVVVSRYEGSDNRGDFRLTIVVGDSDTLSLLEELTRVELSGPERIIDTEHFRIHYTLEGDDASTEAYATLVAETLEEIWDIQINQLGWPAPPNDSGQGGSTALDIYLSNLIGGDDGDGPLGLAKVVDVLGDNPNTAITEFYAGSSVLRLDNDYAEIDGDPISIMRATAAHEFHHAVQHGYDVSDSHLWYHEATAVWIETQTFLEDQDATAYVTYHYDYPELCFGTEIDPGDGLLMYGDWLFIQSLVDQHGVEVVAQLWANIAQIDGFAALERTLAAHNQNLRDALARYRVQNLLRDYALAPQFDDATVWLEATITKPGSWTFEGEGVQELGANYFTFTGWPGVYEALLVEDNSDLQLWAVGIRGDEADSFALGSGGVFDTTSYDHVYLMVFNPAYDNEINDCEYHDYELEIRESSLAPLPVSETWDAAHFLPPD